MDKKSAEELAALKTLEQEIRPYIGPSHPLLRRRSIRWHVVGTILLAVAIAFGAGLYVQEIRLARPQQRLVDSALERVTAALVAAQQRIAELEAERKVQPELEAERGPVRWYEDFQGLNYRSPMPNPASPAK